MSDDEPHEISILDARLAEIDKRLRTIQTGLVVETAEEPAAPAGDPPLLPPRVQVPEPGAPVARLHALPEPPDEGLNDVLEELRGLAADHRGLLTSLRALLADYERLVGDAPAARPPVTVTAGPFAGTDAVHVFEQSIWALPGVRAVELRGYEGSDRVILDVHLDGPSP